MSDPFDSLRGREPHVEPDPDFAASLIRQVQERLDSSSSAAPTIREVGDLDDLEVVPMTTTHSRRPWWLAAAAVLLVAAGVWAIMATRDGDSQSPADDSVPTTTAEPSAGDALPDELIGRWMSGPRPGWSPTIGTSLQFTPSTFDMSPANDNANFLLRGTARSTAAGTVQLTAGDTDCGDAVGSYRWLLSASGRTLTITTEDDSCAARSDGVAGTYWRMACRAPNDNCLGELDTGTYRSQFVRPLEPSPTAWQPLFGAITYTVPDGWANFIDIPGEFGLATTEAFEPTTTETYWPDDELTVIARAGAVTVDGRCEDTNDPEVTTVVAMESRLRELPGLVVGDAQPVTIGGLDGISVDMTIDPATLEPCGSERVVPFATNGEGTFGIGEGSKARLFLLPRPDGNGFFGIVIQTLDAADFDAFAERATPVLESFQFS